MYLNQKDNLSQKIIKRIDNINWRIKKCTQNIKYFQGLLFLEFNNKIKFGNQLKSSEQSKILGDL